jgi:hypothetical protein
MLDERPPWSSRWPSISGCKSRRAAGASGHRTMRGHRSARRRIRLHAGRASFAVLEMTKYQTEEILEMTKYQTGGSDYMLDELPPRSYEMTKYQTEELLEMTKYKSQGAIGLFGQRSSDQGCPS